VYFGTPPLVLLIMEKTPPWYSDVSSLKAYIVDITKKENDMLTQNQAIPMEEAKSETVKISTRMVYKIAGVAASMAEILLLVAMISLIASVLLPGATTGWLLPFQNNWLIVIFKLHAGFSGVQMDLLHVLNFLDIAILALVGTMHLGLYAVLRRTSKIWSIIALAQPFLGIVLFIATKTTGRSSVMGAVLVISVVMLRSNIFKKVTAYMGILASVLLLAGDFSAGIPPLNSIATLFGIGYVLLMTWFFLIARRLFQAGPGALEELVQ
jgi:hypothetical protein